jgi:hypothetical protein
MNLLLLPVALGLLPLWLLYAEHMSQARKVALAVLLLAFLGFVVAGYLVPIKWTGFQGNTLWDWLTLVALPVTLTMIRVLPSSPREIHRTHVGVFGVLLVAWIVTLIGGYKASWRWTGYQGNTLWDWLQLVLAPLVIATVLVPLAVRWAAGDPERKAEEARAQRESVAAATS